MYKVVLSWYYNTFIYSKIIESSFNIGIAILEYLERYLNFGWSLGLNFGWSLGFSFWMVGVIIYISNDK